MLFLEIFCTDKEVTIQGGFNLPFTPWKRVEISSLSMPHTKKYFNELFILLGCTKIVACGPYFPSCNTLDYCYIILLV